MPRRCPVGLLSLAGTQGSEVVQISVTNALGRWPHGALTSEDSIAPSSRPVEAVETPPAAVQGCPSRTPPSSVLGENRGLERQLSGPRLAGWVEAASTC